MLLGVTRRYEPETEQMLQGLGYRFYRIAAEGLIAGPHLAVHRNGPWFFLEHLATFRSAGEVARISADLSPKFAAIEAHKTNTLRPDLNGERADVW